MLFCKVLFSVIGGGVYFCKLPRPERMQDFFSVKTKASCGEGNTLPEDKVTTGSSGERSVSLCLFSGLGSFFHLVIDVLY